MIDDEGFTKLIDFGEAKFLEQSEKYQNEMSSYGSPGLGSGGGGLSMSEGGGDDEHIKNNLVSIKQFLDNAPVG